MMLRYSCVDPHSDEANWGGGNLAKRLIYSRHYLIRCLVLPRSGGGGVDSTIRSFIRSSTILAIRKEGIHSRRCRAAKQRHHGTLAVIYDLCQKQYNKGWWQLGTAALTKGFPKAFMSSRMFIREVLPRDEV